MTAGHPVGRPPGRTAGPTPAVQLRLRPEHSAALERYRAMGGYATRSEAIHRLIEQYVMGRAVGPTPAEMAKREG